MRHDFSKILTLNYIAINLEISDFEMSDKFLDPSIASHEALLYTPGISKDFGESFGSSFSNNLSNNPQVIYRGPKLVIFAK